MKKSLAFAMLMLLLTMLSGIAAAEETDPATPTDLTCPHENTKEIIYFYDSPAYSATGSMTHRVYGPASVVTVCQDCGQEIARRESDIEQEYRPHTMKRGVCVLCGYHEQPSEPTAAPEDIPGERTLFAGQAADDDVLSLTLTYDDLSALNSAKVNTVLVKGKKGSAAIALNVADMMTQTRKTGGSLYLMGYWPTIKTPRRADYIGFPVAVVIYAKSDVLGGLWVRVHPVAGVCGRTPGWRVTPLNSDLKEKDRPAGCGF